MLGFPLLLPLQALLLGIKAAALMGSPFLPAIMTWAAQPRFFFAAQRLHACLRLAMQPLLDLALGPFGLLTAHSTPCAALILYVFYQLGSLALILYVFHRLDRGCKQRQRGAAGEAAVPAAAAARWAAVQPASSEDGADEDGERLGADAWGRQLHGNVACGGLAPLMSSAVSVLCCSYLCWAAAHIIVLDVLPVVWTADHFARACPVGPIPFE